MVFYSGNFWWSRGSHISTLPSHIEDYYTAPEDWILKKKDGIFQAFSSGIQGQGHYNFNYPASKYMSENDLNKILPNDFYIDAYKLHHFDKNKGNQEYINDYFNNSNISYNRESIVDIFLDKLPKHFDFDFYKNDALLTNYSLEELIVHWFTQGKFEERKFNKNTIVPKNFDYNFYRENNEDLKDFTDSELIIHWNLYGKNENRIYSLADSFNYTFYKNYYSDLKHLSDNDLLNHWIKNGKNEGRIYNFDFNFYRNKYNDLKLLSDKELTIHWLKYGENEGRISKIIHK